MIDGFLHMKERNKRMIYWSKVKEGAIIPTKRKEDAGYDIYPCFDEDYMIIGEHQTVMVPTGIATAFSEQFAMILKERGSTGTKGIAQRCGVIDSGFRGEYMVPITNAGKQVIIIAKEEWRESEEGIEFINRKKCVNAMYGREVVVYPYEKAICQGLLIYLPDEESKEVDYCELLSIGSSRGTGMLGSSGK